MSEGVQPAHHIGDDQIRATSNEAPVPHFERTAFTQPRALPAATMAIVTTAGLHHPEDAGFQLGEQTFRVLDSERRDLVLGHTSANFDRSGFLDDLNVVFPIDRLAELRANGAIGAIAPRHLSFMGALDETMSSIRLDSVPAAARLLKSDGVDVVILTPV